MRTLGGNKIHFESHQVDTWWFQCILLVTRLETGVASISRLTARSSYLVPEASSSLGAKTCQRQDPDPDVLLPSRSRMPRKGV